MADFGVNDVLQELARLRAAAGNTTQPPNENPAGREFGDVLRTYLSDVSQSQQNVAQLATEFEQGNADIDLSHVMVELQKNRLEFQFALQVRNKLVSAYQDIMNMPL